MSAPTRNVSYRGRSIAQRQFDRAQNGLLVVLENKSEDFRHLPIAAGMAQEMLLQRLEGLRQLGERRPVAQGAGLSLDHRQIVPPIIDRPRAAAARPVDEAAVLAARRQGSR